MEIYYFLIFEILLLGILLLRRKNKTKLYCVIIGISIFIVNGLRAYDVGGDTYNYRNIFESLKGLTLQGTINRIDWDIGYSAFEYLIINTFNDFQWILIVCAALFSYSLSRLIYKYSEDPCISYLTIFAFNIFQFSMTGVRQTFAMSFGILAIMQYKNNRNMNAVILILLGSTFHISCLVLLIIPILNIIIKNKIAVRIAIVGLVIVNLFKLQISHQLILLLSTRGYQKSNLGGGETTSIVVFLLLLTASFYYSEYYNNYPNESSNDYSILIMASFFEIFVPVQNIFFRLAFYFLVYLTIFIPRFITSIKDIASKNIVRFAMYGALLIMYFGFTSNSIRGAPFHFFWG